MVAILMMSAKLVTLGVKVFWNNNYDVIFSVHDVSNKTLSCDSNYIVDVFDKSLVTVSFPWEKLP